MSDQNPQFHELVLTAASAIEPDDFPAFWRRYFKPAASTVDRARSFTAAAQSLETGQRWEHARYCWAAAGQLYREAREADRAKYCRDLATMLARFRHDKAAQHGPGHVINQDFLVYYARTGGMGAAYFCRNLNTDRPVVLKTFKQQEAMAPERRGQFIRECGTWLRLGRQPHLVYAQQVIFEPEEEDRPYLSLEYIPGRPDLGSSLADHLAKLGRLPLEIALKYALHVCYGLGYAAETLPDFAHRDLKPDNILIAADDTAKVTDLGLARADIHYTSSLEIIYPAGGERVALENPVMQAANRSIAGFAGTVPYIPPEVWLSQPVDLRGDVYALGCILFEMLAGRWPLAGSTMAGWQHAHTSSEPMVLSAAGVSAPDQVQAIISRCLAKTPAERYPDFKDLAADLARCLRTVTGKPAPTAPPAIPPTVAEMQKLAISLIEIGLADEGLPLLEAVIVREPQVAGYRYNLGRAAMSLGRYEQAVKGFQAAIDLDPTYPSSWYNLGLCHFGLGCLDEARQALRKAAKLGHPRAQETLEAIEQGDDDIFVIR
jgi:serine/threonine protein kinase